MMFSQLDSIAKSLYTTYKKYAYPFLLFELVGGVGGSVISLYLFIKITKDMFENEFRGIDTAIIQLAFEARNVLLTKIMFGISLLGGEVILIAFPLVIIILILKKHYKETVLFTLTFIIGVLLNTLLKILFARPRPELSLFNLTDYSFPSGHAMNSFIFYGLIAYFSYHFTGRYRLSLILSTVLLILIFLIGISRIYLRVHYPTDVLAGWLAGFWLLVTMLLFNKLMIVLKLFKEKKGGE